jgi:tetratricopeptide (TPR) repeat protein
MIRRAGLLALSLATSLGAQESAGRVGAATRTDSIALWDGLGDHHHAITTRSALSQRYFDQGLRFVYAFDHPDAIRSFRLAQRIDPTCAMCAWGEALALGPNINVPMDSASGVAAHTAIRRAASLAPGATARERAYIAALATRYAGERTAQRKTLDTAYARAMARLHRADPADADAAVLYAESEMLLGPWDYWLPGRRAKPHGARAVATLTSILRRAPRHAGACHFYIHAVEAAYPERAIPCAERLPSLMPGAGHVVHMPAHVYIRVGRYADAIERNVHALHADEPHIAEMPADGAYRLALHPHNAHFLSFAASMIGRSAQAVEAAAQTRARTDTAMLRAPGLGALQHYYMMPLLANVRFGRWNAVLAEPEPAEDLPYPRALRHYARALARLATGNLDSADSELASLRRLRGDERLKAVTIWDLNTGASLLDVAQSSVEGELAAARSDWTSAVAALRRAVVAEDALTYDEPPPWHLPVRQQLGGVLLRAGRPAEAETAFRQDLVRHPENGWSLAGLSSSLRAQGKIAEASRVQRRFERAWSTADVPAPTLAERRAGRRIE